MEYNLELENISYQKMAASDQLNSFDMINIKPDNLVIDVARLSHPKLKRSLSRKTTPTSDNEKESKYVSSASPRVATLGGVTMLEKPQPNVGPADRAQAHHQITIKPVINGGGCAENKSLSTRPSFKRSQPSWGFDPRKMAVLLASLSSMGTILLIYFTLSVSNSSEDDMARNW